MMNSFFARVLSGSAAVALLAGACFADGHGHSVPTGNYAIDDSHSMVTFKLQHLGLGLYTGQLETVTGTITVAGDDYADSSVTATIAATSVDTDYTGEKDFDTEVANFIQAPAFPEITFTSTGLELTGETSGVLTGDLVFAGVTQSVSLDVELTGAGDHPFAGAPAIGVLGTTSILRSDFGILSDTRLDGALGNEVFLEVSIEAIKQD